MGIEMRQEAPNPAGILGGHDLNRTEQLAGAKGEVTQIAQRRRDDVKRGGHGGKVVEGGRRVNGERWSGFCHCEGAQRPKQSHPPNRRETICCLDAWLNGTRQLRVIPGRRYYFVYILTNVTRSVLYTGVTRDLRFRLAQHLAGIGSSFTKRYHTDRLVWYEVHQDPAAAILREKQLKGGSRKRKIQLIEELNPTWRDMGRDLGRPY